MRKGKLSEYFPIEIIPTCAIYLIAVVLWIFSSIFSVEKYAITKDLVVLNINSLNLSHTLSTTGWGFWGIGVGILIGYFIKSIKYDKNSSKSK